MEHKGTQTLKTKRLTLRRFSYEDIEPSFNNWTNDEEVCIFDDVQALAKEHDTITYEITTTLSPFIKKEII